MRLMSPGGVPQLRQLIDAPAAAEAADPCRPRIVHDLDRQLIERRVGRRLRQPLVCVATHRAELEHPERLSVAARSSLREQSRLAACGSRLVTRTTRATTR